MWVHGQDLHNGIWGPWLLRLSGDSHHSWDGCGSGGALHVPLLLMRVEAAKEAAGCFR